MADIGHGTNCKLSFVIISSLFQCFCFHPFLLWTGWSFWPWYKFAINCLLWTLIALYICFVHVNYLAVIFLKQIILKLIGMTSAGDKCVILGKLGTAWLYLRDRWWASSFRYYKSYIFIGRIAWVFIRLGCTGVWCLLRGPSLVSDKGFRKVFQGDCMIFGDVVTSVISIHSGKSKEYTNGTRVISQSEC